MKFYKYGVEIAFKAAYLVINPTALSMWDYYDFMAGISEVKHRRSLPSWWLH